MSSLRIKLFIPPTPFGKGGDEVGGIFFIGLVGHLDCGF